MGIHTKPSDVEGELNFLDDAYNEVARAFNTTNAFILGDFNADCSYLSKANYNKLDLVSDPRFTWLLETDTTVGGTSCAYDRCVWNLVNGLAQ